MARKVKTPRESIADKIENINCVNLVKSRIKGIVKLHGGFDLSFYYGAGTTLRFSYTLLKYGSPNETVSGSIDFN